MILKPVQKPHPPLWYGVTLPSNAAWPAENNVNIVALGLRDNTSAIIKAYRETRAKHGFDPEGTLIGVSRHVVVADTDDAALAIARRAYPRWRESFRWLFNAARHRAARDRHLSADVRRADGARQRRSPARRQRCGASSTEEIAANQLQLFRAAHGVRQHDARPKRCARSSCSRSEVMPEPVHCGLMFGRLDDRPPLVGFATSGTRAAPRASAARAPACRAPARRSASSPRRR